MKPPTRRSGPLRASRDWRLAKTTNISLTWVEYWQTRARCRRSSSRNNIRKLALTLAAVSQVAHTVSTKDIQGKYVACRCWRSAKASPPRQGTARRLAGAAWTLGFDPFGFSCPQFPNCDGSHMEHNKETGDNVGPLVIVKE